MASHNLSKAALGELQKQQYTFGKTRPAQQLSIRNHEVRSSTPAVS